MPKTIRIPAQETVTIYRRNFSSLVMDIPFDAVALNEEAPKGEVTIQGSNWVFPKPSSDPAVAAPQSGAGRLLGYVFQHSGDSPRPCRNHPARTRWVPVWLVDRSDRDRGSRDGGGCRDLSGGYISNTSLWILVEAFPDAMSLRC
jgi:hypothetical protein